MCKYDFKVFLNFLFMQLRLDKNECLKNNGNCSHYCFNENGSYRCSFPTGYSLKDNGMECEGKLIKQISKIRFGINWFLFQAKKVYKILPQKSGHCLFLSEVLNTTQKTFVKLFFNGMPNYNVYVNLSYLKKVCFYQYDLFYKKQNDLVFLTERLFLSNG